MARAQKNLHKPKSKSSILKTLKRIKNNSVIINKIKSFLFSK